MMPEKNALIQIDVEEVIRSKNPSLSKAIPGFLIRYLKRIIHQEDINKILRDHGHLMDVEFISATLQTMGITYKVFGKENIPSDGRYF
ncbi:MAG TPA: acyltransferase, partial [Bacteroidales bacterium]|nr:acyltransferase [Bacteroidales bacterium]